MYAWPYVFEAKLEEDPNKRATALRFARFLDPDSPRLKSIPGHDTSVQGVSENPFLEAIKQHATGTSL